VTPPVGPADVAINADGSLVAVAGGYDGKVVVFRTSGGEPVGIVPGVPRSSGVLNVRNTATVAFGPDGRLYVGSIAGPAFVQSVSHVMCPCGPALCNADHLNL
jgi:hypothetical protein